MASFKVSAEISSFVMKYAKSHELKGDEAADKLLGIAQTRVKALDKYAKKTAGKAKKAPKKAAKARSAKAKSTKKAAPRKAKSRAKAAKASGGTPKGFKTNHAEAAAPAPAGA